MIRRAPRALFLKLGLILTYNVTLGYRDQTTGIEGRDRGGSCTFQEPALESEISENKKDM